MNYNMWQIIGNSIDWLSVKFTIGSIFLAAITWNAFIGVLSVFALVSTIVYNGIRIYKELKHKK
jgi:large-conductance mechanosensitive channel